MSTQTEYFASHLVPRLTIGHPDNTPDGYAFGQEISVGTDGYVVELRMNTVYELQTRTQALYFGILSPTDCTSKSLDDMDDTEKLALLNQAGAPANGHYLAAGAKKDIASTRKCTILVMKAAASTATVNLNPLGSFVDDLGGR